jgi:hypothetical protein
VERYERNVRDAVADVRCGECDGLIRMGETYARIRVNVWGNLWKTISCCRECCSKAHTGGRPFTETAFGQRVKQLDG